MMTKPVYLTHAKLVLPDDTIDNGAVLVDEGRIRAVLPNRRPDDAEEISLEGALLVPGLIDLHSDAIESIAEPRPGAYFSFDHAAAQIDRLAASCGITTFYNAISFAGEELGLRNEEAGFELVSVLQAYRSHALVDQRTHCRFEVSCGDALNRILEFVDNSMCHLVSYMDHSPGQGQFVTEESYRDYLATRHGYDDQTISELLDRKYRPPGEIQSDVERLAQHAAAARIPLAGHDSDSLQHVAMMKQLGAVISEFPMNREVAKAGLEAGIHQAVGSTNVVRGGSQRNGMAAIELIGEGLADCLCSDYVPWTMIPAVLKVANDLSLPLHHCVNLATLNPAKAVDLQDRGSIETGKRADLVVVTFQAGLPHVQGTLCEGRPVFCSRGLADSFAALSSA